MATSAAQILPQLGTLIKSLSVPKLITLFILLVSTVSAFIVLLTWSGKPELFPIYRGLAPEDAANILVKLKELKVPYELADNGSIIKVPQEKISEIRLTLATEGLPMGSGVGFEIFDNTKLGMTEFEQNVYYQRALQGELSRTINGLEEIESSRIHIVMSQKSLFLEEEEPASVSVIIKMKPGRSLSKNQVQGIVHFVSSSISNLKPENVIIVDNNGTMLAGLNDKSSIGMTSINQMEYQQKKEQLFERRVKSMLETVLGRGKAIVRVSCDFNFIQQEKTEEMFFPENQVVRSEQLSSEYSGDAKIKPSGIPGLATNITKDQTSTISASSNTSFNKSDKTRNYEIGKMTSRKIIPIGKLEKLSVAVVVDGIYQNIITGEGEDAVQEEKYFPRTEQEMVKLGNIVKRAVNFDKERGDKIEVVNLSFAAEKPVIKEEKDPKNKWIEKIEKYLTEIKYISAGFFILLTFLFIIKPLIRWLTETTMQDVQLLQELPKTIEELERGYETSEQNSGLKEKAARIISNNQDDSVLLMQEWLKET